MNFGPMKVKNLFYRGLSCKTMISSTQHSRSSFWTFYTHISAFSALKTSSCEQSEYRKFFVLQRNHLLRKIDKLLSATATLHRFLLRNISCNGFPVKKLSLSYDAMFFKRWVSVFCVQKRLQFLNNRYCLIIGQEYCFVASRESFLYL